MKTIIKVPANSYNDFCIKLSHMMIEVATIKNAGCRYKFYDHMGNKTAEYNETRDHGLVYNYNNKSILTGKILYFN